MSLARLWLSSFIWSSDVSLCELAAGSSLTRVCINPGALPDGLGPSVFNGRYRIDRETSPTWDVAIAPQGVPIAGLFQQNIGTETDLNDKWLDFQLTFTVGLGYSWRVGSSNPELKWDIKVNQSTNGAILNNVGPKDSHNVIELQAINRQTAGQTTEVRNLAFTISNANTCGIFVDMVATAGSTATEVTRQYIVADGDLSSTSWSLTGQVKIQKTVGTSTNPETNKFDVYTKPSYQGFTTCQNNACP